MATVTESIREKYSQQELESMLQEMLNNDDYENEIKIGYSTFSRFDILKTMSPTDFQYACDDLQEEETYYSCDCCGEEFDNEFDAELCCDDEEETYECSCCGFVYRNEEEAECCCESEEE